MKLVPTDEQLVAIDVVMNNQFTKLNAFAGCSKTTTLMMVANQVDMNSLYLAFNKSMAVEAEEKFPSWVTVKTTHALAFAKFGRDIATKLKRPSGQYVNVCGTGTEVARYFRIKDIRYPVGGIYKLITSAGIGRAVRETVNAFEYSADPHITSAHVSKCALKDKKDLPSTVISAYYRTVLDHAKRLWSLRTDPSSDILATHDTYLKLYQLSKPDLSSYPMIYLDEAQDTNECVLDIIKNQTASKIVVVGDMYQQIYQFRGSINAMALLPYAESKLTQSFRFGQPIADIANAILSCGSTKTDIRGWEKATSRVLESKVGITPPRGCTILYRTNMALVLDAVDYLHAGKKVNLEIDVKDFTKLLESAMELKNGNMKGVKHENLLPYASWYDFEDEVTNSSSELSRVYTIVEDGDYERVIGMLKTQSNVDKPDLILTTAHKSKGREFDMVMLADDFPSNFNSEGEWVGLNDMERNLLYVGATRARRVLVLNSTIQEILNRGRIPAGQLPLAKISDEVIEDAYDKIIESELKKLNADCFD